MESKTCTKRVFEKMSTIFMQNFQNVENVTVKEFRDVTMITKIKYQVNER